MSKTEELEAKIHALEEANKGLEEESFDLTSRILNMLEFGDIRRLSERRHMSMEEVFEAIRNSEIGLDEITELMDTPKPEAILKERPQILSDNFDQVQTIAEEERVDLSTAGDIFLEREGIKRMEAKKAEKRQAEAVGLETERKAEEVRPLVQYLDELIDQSEVETERGMLEEIKGKIS